MPGRCPASFTALPGHKVLSFYHFALIGWLMINGLLLGIYMNIKTLTNSCVLLSFELWTGAKRGSTITTKCLFTTDS